MYSPRLARTLVAALAAICSLSLAQSAHADVTKCKSAVIKASAAYAQARSKALQKCEDTNVKKLFGSSVDCATDLKVVTTVGKARAKVTSTVTKACPGSDCADIGFPATCPTFEASGTCNAASTDCAGIATCLTCVDDAAVDQAIDLSYASLVDTDPKDKTKKALNKCQSAIGKVAAGFFAAKSKALSKCWDKVNKGKATGPCPTAAEAPKIAVAAGKISAGILKACAGKDKLIGGSDVNADLSPTDIGFPANCSDVDPVGGPSCAGTITGLQDLINCVTCVNQFKADCADGIGAAAVSAYPNACKGPTSPATPTPTATATPTAAPTARPCGDGSDPQVCQPDSPGFACGESFACTNCNCACPSRVEFAGDATSPNSILDTGWTGISHRAPIITNGDVSVSLSCAASQRPCGQCSITGPIANANAGAGQLDNQRCSTNPAKRCTSDATCQARTCLGGGPTEDGTPCTADADCTPGTCPAAGTCAFYFGSALPLAAGGVTTCISNTFNGPVSGTANVETGEAATAALLTSRVFLATDVDRPCPQCVNDPTVNDGASSGTCGDGARLGLPCDGNGSVPGRPDFGTTSLDCPPNPSGIIATLPIDLSNSTGTVTRTLSTASPNCAGSTGDKCLCNTCNSPSNAPCFTNADCPDPAGAIGPVCGGRRCLGGSNIGGACSVASECPSSNCAVPGEAAKPSSCADDTTTVNRVMECADPDGDSEGVCTIGPIDQNCSIASGHAQRGCMTDADCGPNPVAGSCKDAPRPCFLTGGGTFQAAGKNDGTDTLIARGMADPPDRDVANPTLGAIFCIGPTGSASINGVAGLPGPGRVTIQGTAVGLP